MLSRLQVRNYVLIDSLEIDFPEGLVIITGQTGAGKSILLGALSLITGAKADASMVSEDADNCVVEAEFVSVDATIKSILEENEVEWEDGNLIVRRVVNRSGRSRAFVNDSPVPVTLLQEIASHLIDIHSQHQTLQLSDRRFQLDILDLYADDGQLLQDCSASWHELMSLKTELAGLETRIARISIDKEYNEAQFNRLDSASLRAGELAELEEEQKQLANAEEIKSCLYGVETLLEDVSLKDAARMLSKIAGYLPSASSLSERIDSCRLELDDILAETVDANSRIEISQARLEQVESRMSQLYGLLKMYGCADESELIAFKDRLSEELYDSTRLEEQAEELRRSISGLEERVQRLADELHASRSAVATAFMETMTEMIRGLELPYAVFEVELQDAPLSASGRDAVVFRFSSTGRNTVEVAKCASGGEMSRIMLALKYMMAKYTSMPTMIFDEIDTGVSGSVADKMGSMICSMGEHMQVFAITHLPQVAAKGDAHYIVSKSVDPVSSKAVSTIGRISGRERLLEVARMLSGSVLTEAAIANARALLDN